MMEESFLSSVVEAETSRCLCRRNLRVQPVQLCDGFLLSCETPSTARCPAVDSSMALWIPLSGALHDFKGFQLVRISVSFVTSA